jgi:hypothetical protein
MGKNDGTGGWYFLVVAALREHPVALMTLVLVRRCYPSGRRMSDTTSYRTTPLVTKSSCHFASLCLLAEMI